MNPIINEQFNKLKEVYKDSILLSLPDGSSFIVQVPEVTLPDGWSQQRSKICFVIPVGYPVAKPDCFWADKDLRLSDGRMPINSSPTAMPNGVIELWFSWHSAKWNPNTDDLLTYLHIAKTRFRELR